MIVLEPCYDSYVPNIELAGGTVVRVPLTPGTFRPDFDKIAAALTPRTRAIIVNTPHNPSATVWTEAEMRPLEELLAPTDVLLISDEVYEHMVFDGARHESAARFPGLAARSLHRQQLRQDLSRDRLEGRLRGGAGAADGGVPQGAPVQRVHGQHADAARAGAATWPTRALLELPAFYQRKRDLFAAGLARHALQAAAQRRAPTSSASTSAR